MNKNQVKYLRALDAWADAGSPIKGPVWEEFQSVWESLTPEEQRQIDTAKDLNIPDPSERFDEYMDYADETFGV